MAQPLTQAISHGFMHLVFRLLARWEVEGRENVPAQGPLLVIANHVHYLDPPLIDASLPLQVLFLAKRELVTQTRGWQRWCIIHYGLIPMDRTRLDRRAFQSALDHLAQGGAVGVFPEGTRSRSGVLRAPQRGAAFLALSSQAPILPVAVIGLAGLRLGPFTLLRRPRVLIRIGAPFTLPPTASETTDRAALQAASEEMMGRIAALLPEEQRGTFRDQHGAPSTEDNT